MSTSPEYLKIESQKLNSGYEIPRLGLGTWKADTGLVAKAVEHALKGGYRHIDAAWIYGNEAEVGEGIKASGVPRSEIFLTSKLWSTYHDRVEEALDETLKNLGTDYLDLYLIHWPIALNSKGNHNSLPSLPDGSRDVDTKRTINETWADLEKLLATKKVRSIGVSNFSITNFELLKKTAKVIPAVNQVEIHAYLPQHKLVDYLTKQGVVVTGYSPLGSTDSPLLQDEDVAKVAKKYGVSNATVLISYTYNRNLVVIPKSTNLKRVDDNYKVIKLDSEDLEALGSIYKKHSQRFVVPNWGVDLQFDVDDGAKF